MKNLLKLLGLTFLIACLLGLLLLMAGLLLKWNTTTQFSNLFFGAGTFAILFGLMSVQGGFKMRSDFNLLYTQSAGDMNTFERSRRWIADLSQAYNFYVVLLLIGLYLIGFAVLIPNLF